MNAFDPRLKAFDSNIFPVGIDLRRSIITQDAGIYVADPNATFRQGYILAQSTTGQFVVADNAGSGPVKVPFGFAKWNKVSSIASAVVDEPVVLTGTTASSLKFGSLLYSTLGLHVSDAPGMTGTVFAETTDYTYSATNGTITRSGGSTIPSGSTVYVTYSHQLTEADLDFQGRNFFNFTDDVTIAQGRIAIITGWTLLFTTAYDPSRTYAIGEPLYVGTTAKAGLLTNDSTGTPNPIARVFQLPTADDPFLGIVSPGHSEIT
jgi:hypothetical protein